MNKTELRLVADNLGPIRHADVVVKPLTVLIGRNNTGKTYLAQALYAAHKAIEKFPRSAPENLTDSDHDALRSVLVSRLATDGGGESSLILQDLPRQLPEKLTDWVDHALKDTGNVLNERLCAYFGVPDLGDITRWDTDGVVVKVLNGESGAESFDSKGNASVDRSRVLSVAIDGESAFGFPPLSRFLPRNGDDQDNEFLNQELFWVLCSNVWRAYVSQLQLGGSAHYLPAGRSGLLHAWTDVVKLRLQLERDRFGLVRPESDLGGIAIDFISSLADVLGRHSHYRYRRQLSLFDEDSRSSTPESLVLLRELMGGNIRAGSEEDMVPTLNYEQSGHRLPIRRTSSMVADLAPLAMWIDRLIRPGDLLIIDEPESHLHPEAIRLVARVLVRLVNEGIRVVCATHSSVLLHELSNCILRERARNTEQASDHVYLEADRLAHTDIAVHRFYRSDPTNAVDIEHVQIDPDWGIPEDEHVRVAGDLSDETARLIGSLV